MAIAYAFGPHLWRAREPRRHARDARRRGASSRVEAVGYWVRPVRRGACSARSRCGGLPRLADVLDANVGPRCERLRLAASHIHINWAGAFIVEVMLTAIFVYVILAVTAKGATAATSRAS